MSRPITRRGLCRATAALVLVNLFSLTACASLDLLVRDPSGGADDVAHVILFYPDSGQQDLGYTPVGNTNGRTWDLLTQSQILSRGAGTYTLRIIHHEDTNADCGTAEDEVLGTYEITFGGGIVVSAVDDDASSGGSATTIDVLENDLLVDASSFSFGTMPCPLSAPDPECACSTYDSGQCPSSLSLGVNYVQGQFDVTVGDGSLGLLAVGDPPHGTAAIVGDQIHYTPDAGFCGIDLFSYTVQRSGSLDTGTVTVHVTASPPVTQDDRASTPEGSAVEIDVLANDGSGLSIVSLTQPMHGEATIVGERIRYMPHARFEGADRFLYVAENACGSESTSAVEIDVTHLNHAPTANAGAFYEGVVGEPVLLDASFSSDPDLSDRLEYRWDLDDDGRFDTAWSLIPHYEATFNRRIVGRIAVEVRDVYRGQPNGTSDRATSLIRIDSRQTIEIHVFEDLNGDDLGSDDEPALSDIDVTVGGESLRTGTDGRASIELAEGTWDVAMSATSRQTLEERGFVVVNPATTVELGIGERATVEIALRKISARFKGAVYVDTNQDGEFDDEDRPVAGLLVVLDGDEDRSVLTDADGRFAFPSVLFGSHSLFIVAVERHEDEGEPPSLLVPIALARGERNELSIPWPYDLGPERGFLQVEVEKGRGD